MTVNHRAGCNNPHTPDAPCSHVADGSDAPEILGYATLVTDPRVEQTGQFPPMPKGQGTGGFAALGTQPGDCTCPDVASLDPNCPEHGTAKALTAEYGDPPDSLKEPQIDPAWTTPTDAPGYAPPPPVPPALAPGENEICPVCAGVGGHADTCPHSVKYWTFTDIAQLSTGDYAAEVAREAIKLFTGARNATYGDATDNFTDIANLWAVVFGHEVTAEQVAICSALIKIARLKASPTHDDTWVDATAYMALGAGINRRRQDT